MTLEELEQHLLALSPSEKVQAIQLLAQSLGNIWQGIEKTPGVCGGDARITNTRIPIWVLVEARRLGYSDADIITSYPTVSASDLANAWAYAQAYPDEVELAIQRNEALFGNRFQQRCVIDSMLQTPMPHQPRNNQRA